MRLRYIIGLFVAASFIFSGCKKTPDYVPNPHKCECGSLTWQGKEYQLLDAEQIRTDESVLYSRRFYITANVALEGESQTHNVNTWIEIPDVLAHSNGLFNIDVTTQTVDFTAKVDEFNLNDPFFSLRQYGVRQGVVRVTPAPLAGGTETVSYQFILGELNSNGNMIGPDITYSGSFTVSVSGVWNLFWGFFVLDWRIKNTIELVMYLRILIIGLFPILVSAQLTELREVVMRKHPNGSPHVVLYFTISNDALAKEHVYFPDGKTAWVGHYKNNVEEGSWEFFWENGQLKSKEFYTKGKENGTCYYYDQSGKMTKEAIWKNGKLIKETKF